MTIDGRWTIMMKTPLGAQPATLTLRSDGSRLEGAMESLLAAGELSQGVIDGESLQWVIPFKLPRPGPAIFTARIEGDTISGAAKLDGMVAMPFTGSRAAA